MRCDKGKLVHLHMLYLQAYRIFNTWMGDVQKLQLLSGVIRVIKEQDLLDKTRDVGFFLVDGLTQLVVRSFIL